MEPPFDKDYVWFDALLNYATGVGYKQIERKDEFQKWWTENPPVHLVGKDILTTHTVYWPTMLIALGVALPRTVFGHGWWLAAGGEKMSKSKGNVMNPLVAKGIVGGANPLRYFLTRDIFFGNDAAFSPDLLVARVQSSVEALDPQSAAIHVLEVLRLAGILWSPIMPEKCAALLRAVGWQREPSLEDARTVLAIAPGTRIAKSEPLFPRIEWKAETQAWQ